MRTRILTSLLFVLCTLVPARAQSNGVPAGLVKRTFYIKAGNIRGTAFAIGYKDKQYLVTARHVVASLPRANAPIQVFQTGDWKDFVVSRIKTPKNNDVDIAVLAFSDKLMSDEDVSFGELSAAFVNLGGEVYFLGYPYGLHTLMGAEYVPFVKRGVLSAIDSSDPTASLLYIDGFNNEGFSGGPVVAFNAQKNTWKIIGVVQGYLPEAAKVRVNRQNVDANVLVNSDILVAYNIKHALEAVDEAGTH